VLKSSSPNNVALVDYTNLSGNGAGADYYYGIVGNKDNNAACNRGDGGVNGHETDKCIGQWADHFVRMDFDLSSPPPPNIPNAQSFLSLRFTPNASPLTCTAPDPQITTAGGFRGLR
jgi:hypothetical protein